METKNQSSLPLYDVGSKYTAKSADRHKININREWKFTLGEWGDFDRADINKSAPSFNDAAWQNIGLPHSFSEPYYMDVNVFMGHGWYRKHINIDPNWVGKRISLEFEGVYRTTELFVNGIKVGLHNSGYTGFTFDITEFVHSGDNVIAVRVNNLWNPGVAPRAGDHQFSGGIYRDAYLVVKNPVHVTWYGTFISTPLSETTPKRKPASGSYNINMNVNVKTEIKNDSGTDKSVTINTYVIDKNNENKIIARMQNVQLIKEDLKCSYDQMSDLINSPHLWHVDDPYLYKVYTEVYDDTTLVDIYETNFGFRWYEFCKDQGFFINGEHLFLRGANVHQDIAGWGDAAPNEAIYRDVLMIKEAGMNFIRGSHYPHDPMFAEACDELGLLFMSELNYWGQPGGSQTDTISSYSSSNYETGAYPPTYGVADAIVTKRTRIQAAFEQSCIEQLKAMIRIFRNNPSICLWSVGNEAFFTDPSSENEARQLITKLVSVARADDPTRHAGMGGTQRSNHDVLIDYDNGIATTKAADYQEQYVAGYNGDGAKVCSPATAETSIGIGVANLISEYSSSRDIRPGKAYDPRFGDVGSSNGSYDAPEWRSGIALWCAYHHGTRAGAAYAEMGMIDYNRLPLKPYYWYRYNWLGQDTQGYNEPYYGITPPEQGRAEPEWPKPGNPVAIKLSLGPGSNKIIKNDGTSDTQIVITLIDASGKRVSADNTVTLSVDGPGMLPSYDRKTISRPVLDMIDGMGAVNFRSYYAGNAKITATAVGLKSDSLTLTITGNPEDSIFEPDMTIPKRSLIDTEVKPLPETGSRNLAINKPTGSSSFVEGHTSDKTVDLDPNSYWKANTNNANEYCQLDLEGTYFIERLKYFFHTVAVYQYKIESSEDEQSWSLVSDHTANNTKQQSFELVIDPISARYVRITYTGVPENVPANLAGVEAYGISTSG